MGKIFAIGAAIGAAGAAAAAAPLVTAATIVGGAAVAGGLIASSGAKSAAKTQAESQAAALSSQERAAAEEQVRVEAAVAKKQAAIENIKFPTFLETPEAQEFKQTLQDRIAGRGLIDVSKETAPVAQQIRAGFKEQTVPAIGAAASARGLGRSTIPVNRIALESAAAERDIAERVSKLELQRQGQIERANTQFGLLAEQESRSQQLKANFERGGEFEVADTGIQAAQIFKENEDAIADSIRQEGAIAAANRLLQAEILAGGLVGAGAGASSALQTQSIIDALDRFDGIGGTTGNAALVSRSTNPVQGPLQRGGQF